MASFVTGELGNDLTLGEVLRLGMLFRTRSQAMTRRKIKETFKGLKESTPCSKMGKWGGRKTGHEAFIEMTWVLGLLANQEEIISHILILLV